jgi:hypothetical protein
MLARLSESINMPDELMKCFGSLPLFLAFAIICVAALLFVRFLVTETKGRSLEDIRAICARERSSAPEVPESGRTDNVGHGSASSEGGKRTKTERARSSSGPDGGHGQHPLPPSRIGKICWRNSFQSTSSLKSDQFAKAGQIEATVSTIAGEEKAKD